MQAKIEITTSEIRLVVGDTIYVARRIPWWREVLVRLRLSKVPLESMRIVSTITAFDTP